MRKQYERPQLTVIGSVEDLTQGTKKYRNHTPDGVSLVSTTTGGAVTTTPLGS